jgi:hypothetical protein
MKYRNILTLSLLTTICSSVVSAQNLIAQDYQRVETPNPQVNPYVKNLADPNTSNASRPLNQYVPNQLLTEPTIDNELPATMPTPIPTTNTKILTGGEVIDLSPAPTASFPFLSGGVGADEVANMQAQKSAYNLHIMSADKIGNFTGEINLIIKDKTGAEIFNGLAGPLFYAKLPNGTYHVIGERNGETKQQKINVGKSSHIHFGW